VLLGLHRLRKLIDGDMRLRTACDLEPVTRDPKATRPDGFVLPTLSDLETDLRASIEKNKSEMVQTQTTYDAKIESAKKKTKEGEAEPEAEDDDETNGEG
jgi:CRISPR-associated protein Csb1